MYYAYGPAPLRCRAGVVRFKMLFVVVSFLSIVVSYIMDIVFYILVLFVALMDVVGLILIVVAAIFVDHISRWWNVMGIVIFFLASFAYSYYTFTNKAPSRTASRTSVTKPSDESTGLVKEKSHA